MPPSAERPPTVRWISLPNTKRPTRPAGGVHNLYGWGHHSKQVLNRSPSAGDRGTLEHWPGMTWSVS